jgi:hypothetical protein
MIMKIKALSSFLVILMLLLSLSSVSLTHAQEQNIQEKELRSIAQINNDLSKIRVKAMESDMPPSAIPLFSELKHALLNLISETINDKSSQWKSVDELKAIITSKLIKEGMQLPKEAQEEKPEYSYDQYQNISVEKPLHHKNLIVVTTTLWVMCGEDTSFYVFKKEGGKWNLLLAEEATSYNDILGAHSRFGYSISPPDKRGRFYIVTANVNPWCTSNWQGLRYSVYRPAQSPFKPKVLLKKEATIYLGIDPPVYKIKTSTDKFRLEFSGDWYATPDTVPELRGAKGSNLYS